VKGQKKIKHYIATRLSRRFWWERLNGAGKMIYTRRLLKSFSTPKWKKHASVRYSDNAGLFSETKPSDPSG